MEYLHRLEGKKFAPCLNIARDPPPTPPVINLGLSPECINGYVELLQQRAKLQESSKDMYTSKYGITVNLEHLKMWSAPDFQQILSLPHLFAIVLGHRCTQYVLGQLVVQFRDEDQPRIYNLPDCEDYRLFHCGRHVFVSTFTSEEMLPVSEERGLVFYASEKGLLQVLPNNPNVQLRPGAVYDGYFCFCDDSEGLTLVQAGLDGRTDFDYVYLKGLVCQYVGVTGCMLLQVEDVNFSECYFWDMAHDTVTTSSSSIQVYTSDIPIFLSVPYPGIDSVDLEMAEAQEEEPIEPERAPFALFAALHHLTGTLKKMERGHFVRPSRVSDTWGSS